MELSAVLLRILQWLGPSSIIAAAVYYSRPHIAFVLRGQIHDDGRHYAHISIKNLEPVDIDKSFVLAITVKNATIELCQVYAGPWYNAESSRNGNLVKVLLSGMPADGVVDIRTVCDKNANVTVQVAEDSELRPRGFEEAARWTFPVAFGSLAIRALVGWACAASLYAIAFPTLQTIVGTQPPWQVLDWVIVSSLLVMAVVLYLIAVGFRGKSIACGFSEPQELTERRTATRSN